MTTQSLHLLLLLSLVVLQVPGAVSLGLGVRKVGGLAGGWTPIDDVKDPHVQELGEFAVSEHNQQEKTDLQFDQVVRGETQVVSGANYRLVVAAKDGSVTNNYEAVVWEKTWLNLKSLTSFKQV